MNFEPRPYQAKALDKIYTDLQVMPEVLLSGIMGAGKTFMSVRLIQRLYNENPGMTFLILAHKRELISQFENAFKEFTDIHFRHIGVCCAGLKNKRLDRQITIASVQTFVNMKEKYSGAGLIVIDECHRIDINGNTQYKQIIDYLRLQRPQCRILGISATVYRLGSGFIYGHKCKLGNINLFSVCNHKITYDELRQEGHLVPLKGVIASHDSLEQDLAGISVSGDYNLSELGEICTREYHVQTAVEAIDKYCSQYDCVCVVCVNINHAKMLHEILDDSTIVHSQLNDLDRQANMVKWESGQVKIMVSVEILLEGYDLPRLKAIVMVRPTLSTGLYLQTVGRVLRTCEGKDHGFLLDVTDNTSRLCPSFDLDNVKITVPKAVEKAEAKEREMWKICPGCNIEIHVALRECGECGFLFEPSECIIAEALPEMESVVFTKSPPEWHEVKDWSIEIHTSKKNNKKLGRVTFMYEVTDYKTEQVSMWLCFADEYTGFAVDQAKNKWVQISHDEFPDNVKEFMEASFNNPVKILVDHNGRYPNLQEVESEIPEKTYYEPNSEEYEIHHDDYKYDDEIPF